ncbi:MAG: hypothetical protein ABJD24_11955 [Acidimicrobiales bacterium]
MPEHACLTPRLRVLVALMPPITPFLSVDVLDPEEISEAPGRTRPVVISRLRPIGLA